MLCVALLSCPPVFKQMLEKKSYPCDPLPFSSSSTDNKRKIKPNGGADLVKISEQVCDFH